MLENCYGNTTKEEAIKAGFLKTDDEFLKQGVGSGACCVTALIEGNELVISNIGDCRAVLCKGGKAEALTVDHRASNEDERKRIENKGGFVVNHRGAWRVHGILAVSRSIGDAHLKDWVVAEPETKILQLTSDMDCVVLASDGLWEEVGNQEAIDVVMRSCAVEKGLGLGEDAAIANNDERGCVMSSPKLRRILQVKAKKQNSQSPCYNKTADRWKESENNFASENESPTPKAQRTSSMATSQTKMINQAPIDQGSSRWKDGFGSENDSPPSKARKISMVNQIKTRVQNPDQENNTGCKKTAASDQLMAACRELVNLAVNKGSLDDITVMIIDLNNFKE